jgi:protease IV
MNPILRILSRLNPLRLVARAWLLFNNWRRGMRPMETVVLDLPSQLDPLPGKRSFVQRRILGDPGPSLYDIHDQCQRIAQDDRVQNVVVLLNGVEMSLADVNGVRQSFQTLRDAGKRVLCFAHDYDTRSYYLASVADEVVLLPGGIFAPLGLHARVVFLKDALATIGVEVDGIAISPYKNAVEPLTSTSFSEESHAMYNWMFDGQYDVIVQGIAAGRGMSVDAVQAMIDNAPYSDTDALHEGFIDATITQEELPQHLNSKDFVPWDDAVLALRRRPKPSPRRQIAVLQATGTIIDGESQTPPVDIPLPMVGSALLGHVTFTRQVRSLLEDETVAALVVLIDSGGGSATASEAMYAALQAFAAHKPLVMYLNGAAASGGYYMAVAGQYIMANPGTVTGSIGVLTARASVQGVLDNLKLHVTEISRGANAGLFRSPTAFTPEQRASVRGLIESLYAQFVQRVATARNMTPDAVDAVGGGRVWTGAQALEHGLVDALGTLPDAIAEARRRANLPDHAPVLPVTDRGDSEMMPIPPEAMQPGAATLMNWVALRQMARLLGGLNNRPLYMLPWWWGK